MKDQNDLSTKTDSSTDGNAKKLPHDHGQQAHIQQLQDHMPKDQELSHIANIYKQIDDEKRLKIFWILCHVEECVINLAAMMDMSSPAVSHHLSRLKASGLIVSSRKGKEVYYKAADTKEVRLLHDMIEELVDITCPIS